MADDEIASQVTAPSPQPFMDFDPHNPPRSQGIKELTGTPGTHEHWVRVVSHMLGLEVSAIRHDLVSPDGLETGLSGYDCAFHPSNTNGAVLKFRLISYPNARNGEHLVYQCLETYIPNNVAKSVSESLYGTMKLSMTALPQFFAKLRAIRVRSVSRQASQVSLSASV